MTELEKLCARLDSLNREANRIAGDLERRAQFMAKVRDAAASALAGTSYPGATEVFASVEHASRATQQAAALLHQAAISGTGFVQRHGANPGAGGSTPLDSVRPPSGSTTRSDESSLASWWGMRSSEYVPPTATDWAPVPSTLAPHSDPRAFAAWVNDGGSGKPGRGVNCADCARAVEASWRGSPQVSAARAPGLGGESFAAIEEWLGQRLEPASFASIGEALAAAGPGASAYVVVTWKGGGGHAFNAVNDRDTVLFIDAQPTGGAVDRWPPTRASPGYGFDESDVEQVFVSFEPA